MKRLWLNFLANGLGLAAVALVFRLAFWAEPHLWRVVLWLLGFLGAIWLVDGALLLLIGLREWRRRRAR